MRVAALADIHGNIHALDAVLADERCTSAGLVVVLGDVVAGPFPAQTFDRLAELGDRVRILRGNSDRLVLEEDDAVCRWRREQLGPQRAAAVRSWPETFVIEVEGLGDVCCCHATPTSDELILTRDASAEDIAAALAGTRERIVVAGHIHVQLDRAVDGYRFVNVGSIGWPYEGPKGAYWALLGRDVDFMRTEYDVEAAVAAIRASGHPLMEERLAELLDPSLVS
jgi:putative phosphoesterase